MGNVGVIGTEHGVNIDGYVVDELLDHGAELGAVRQVSVSAMEADVVFSLQLGPNRFLAIKGRAIRHLEARMEAAELVENLVAAMRTVVVHHQIRLDSSVGVLQGARQLDEELLGAGDVRGVRQHVELAALDTIADGAEQSDGAQKIVVLRRGNRRRRKLPCPDGLRPDLKSRLVHVDQLISARPLKAMDLAGEGDALQLVAPFGVGCDSPLRFRLLKRDAIPAVDALEGVFAELAAVLAQDQLPPPRQRQESHLVQRLPGCELRLELRRYRARPTDILVSDAVRLELVAPFVVEHDGLADRVDVDAGGPGDVAPAGHHLAEVVQGSISPRQQVADHLALEPRAPDTLVERRPHSRRCRG